MKPSAILLASFLATAHASFQITIKTGSDKSVGLVMDLDEVERPYRGSTEGLSASVSEDKVYCQAFSDPHARDELGDVFSRGKDAVFHDSEPQHIGSFLCSKDKKKLQDGDPKDKEDSDDEDEEEAVRVQFRIGFAEFRQSYVEVGEVTKLADIKITKKVFDAAIVGSTRVNLANANCQLFKDDEGKEKIGDKITARLDVGLGADGADVGSIKCEKN